jgi:hypothetical protein
MTAVIRESNANTTVETIIVVPWSIIKETAVAAA